MLPRHTPDEAYVFEDGIMPPMSLRDYEMCCLKLLMPPPPWIARIVRPVSIDQPCPIAFRLLGVDWNSLCPIQKRAFAQRVVLHLQLSELWAFQRIRDAAVGMMDCQKIKRLRNRGCIEPLIMPDKIEVPNLALFRETSSDYLTPYAEHRSGVRPEHGEHQAETAEQRSSGSDRHESPEERPPRGEADIWSIPQFKWLDLSFSASA